MSAVLETVNLATWRPPHTMELVMTGREMRFHFFDRAEPLPGAARAVVHASDWFERIVIPEGSVAKICGGTDVDSFRRFKTDFDPTALLRSGEKPLLSSLPLGEEIVGEVKALQVLEGDLSLFVREGVVEHFGFYRGTIATTGGIRQVVIGALACLAVAALSGYFMEARKGSGSL